MATKGQEEGIETRIDKKKKKKKRYRSCGRKGEEGGRGVARQRGIKHGTRSNSYKM